METTPAEKYKNTTKDTKIHPVPTGQQASVAD
jgi:hypothetical protein